MYICMYVQLREADIETERARERCSTNPYYLSGAA